MPVISVLEVCGEFCVLPEDGERLCVLIAAELEAGHETVVDFAGVKDLIPLFLCAAIGPLYGMLPRATPDELLRFEGLDEIDAGLVAVVRDNAIRFHSADESTQRMMTEVWSRPFED